MTKHLFSAIIPACALLMVTGCTDDNYDLDSLDQTVAISVNDLVVPVNVDQLVLNNLIDTSDDFIEMTDKNGNKYYAFKRSGEFKSDPINIKTFTVHEPEDLEPTSSGAMKDDNVDPDLNIATDIKYNIDYMRKDFMYKIRDVEDKVKIARQIETDNFYIKISLTVPAGMMQTGDKLTFKNLKIKFPKGLWAYDSADKNKLVSAISNIGTYDANTGLLTINNYVTDKAVTDLVLKAQVLDLNPPKGLVNDNGSIDFENSIIFESGSVILHTTDLGRLPNTFDFYAYYDLPTFDVVKFSGYIEYTLEGLNFDPIDLDDMPDVLTDPETRIKIANPQLYLAINNTCTPYNLGGQIGLELVSNRRPGSITYKLPGDINVSNTVEKNKYSISPAGADLNAIAGYDAADGAVLMPFPELSEVLYGNEQMGYGIPDNIDVEFTKSDIKGETKHFPLGTEIPAVTGDYQFIAPIALDKGSIIVYTGETIDWDIDVDDITINTFTLQTTATSDLPIDLNLSAKLYDKNGKEIAKSTEAVLIPAMAENAPVKIVLEIENPINLKELDGLKYTAKAAQDKAYDNPQNVPAVSPDMHLTLGTLKATVNGRYVTNLDDDND
ncbi:MAG: hypothetical protein K2H86_04450 [Muribaculaceae bacterium]|nr:hypothetical protein [Muribaculaceae bacterium]